MYDRMIVDRLLASVLVGCMVGCATPQSQVAAAPSDEPRVANLERAAKYPWKDDGACAVREASGEWRALVERCFYALDRSRIMFRDIEHRCPVAQVDATTVEEIVGVCLLAQPELAVGAVIVIGAVVVAAAIATEIEAARARKRMCTCLCAKTGVLLGDGSVKVKDLDACHSYCAITYEGTRGVCR